MASKNAEGKEAKTAAKGAAAEAAKKIKAVEHALVGQQVVLVAEAVGPLHFGKECEVVAGTAATAEWLQALQPLLKAKLPSNLGKVKAKLSSCATCWSSASARRQ